MIAELARIALHGDQDKVRVAAAKELLDRGYGRPAQTVEMTGAEGAPLLDWRALLAKPAEEA